MININLLATKKKAAKKLTELQQHVIFGTLILGVVVSGMVLYYSSLTLNINRLEKATAAAKVRIKEQDVMLREVKMVEEERKRVAEKIALIEELKKNQTLLVHMVDQIGSAVPKGVNIVTLTESKGQTLLEGTAFTNHDVVRFVDNLKAIPSMADVFLLETVLVVQDGFEIYRYKLQFNFKGV